MDSSVQALKLSIVLDPNQSKCCVTNSDSTCMTYWTAVGGKKVGINVLLAIVGTNAMPHPSCHTFTPEFRVVREDNGTDVSIGPNGEATVEPIGSVQFRSGCTEPVKATLRLNNLTSSKFKTNFYVVVEAPVELSSMYLKGELNRAIQVKTKPNKKQESRPASRNKRAMVPSDNVFLSLHALVVGGQCIGCGRNIPYGCQLKKTCHAIDCVVKDYLISRFNDDGVVPLSAGHSNGRCVFCKEKMNVKYFHLHEYHRDNSCDLMALPTQDTTCSADDSPVSEEDVAELNQRREKKRRMILEGCGTIIYRDGTAQIVVEDVSVLLLVKHCLE